MCCTASAALEATHGCVIFSSSGEKEAFMKDVQRGAAIDNGFVTCLRKGNRADEEEEDERIRSGRLSSSESLSSLMVAPLLFWAAVGDGTVWMVATKAS